MASSLLNIFVFLITTILYYLKLKPNMKLDDISSPEKLSSYTSASYKVLGVYLLLVIVSQLCINAYSITSICGGSVTENIGAAGIYTFLPWSLIFGIVLLTLIIFPGFKSAFSDVIGYYFVYGSANKVLTELLIDKDIQKTINDSSENKEKLQDAADAIIKICGNMSILINQIVPDNFNDYWKILDPLMKPKYQNNSPASADLKNQLFELVVTRDNVGESMWYIYTGILLTSIVQMKLTTRGCKSSPATMAKNYQQFLEEDKKAKENEKIATGTTYVMSG